MATLPPRRISATSTLRHVLGRLALRFAIGAAGAAVGAGVALARGFSFSDLRAALESVGTQLGDPTTLAALGVAAAAVIYALRPRKLLRLLVLK